MEMQKTEKTNSLIQYSPKIKKVKKIILANETSL